MTHRIAAVDAVRSTARGRAPTARLGWLTRALQVVRTVIGAPDYDRYVAHMNARHPGCELISRDDFMKQRLESRYSRPGSRCC
jgi:uncharacterized short protein YbdD (DUF466 family)